MRASAHRFPLVVFDWDGTLIDSIAAIVDCTQKTLADLGQPPVAESRIRAGIGIGLREAVENLSPGCSEELFIDICLTYRRNWQQTYRHRPLLFPGVVEMLAELDDAGFVMAVATAKTRDGLEHDLASTGTARFFRASRTMNEAPGKPDPRMVLDILDETGFDAYDALLIGDSVHDMRMAANAGVTGLGVSSGTEPEEVLLAEGAVDCLDSVTAVPDWLRSHARTP